MSEDSPRSTAGVRGPPRSSSMPDAAACRERARSNKSTPIHVRSARLSGPPMPGAQSSAPGNRRFMATSASMKRRGLLVRAKASVSTTTCGASSVSINAGSCIIRCHETGRRGPVPPASPASASSISGGRTCPRPTDHAGPGASKPGTSKHPRDVRVSVAGSVRVVWAWKGARDTSVEGSPSSNTSAGVRASGEDRSPRPQLRANRSRDWTVRPSTPSMPFGSRTSTSKRCKDEGFKRCWRTPRPWRSEERPRCSPF